MQTQFSKNSSLSNNRTVYWVYLWPVIPLFFTVSRRSKSRPS